MTIFHQLGALYQLRHSRYNLLMISTEKMGIPHRKESDDRLLQVSAVLPGPVLDLLPRETEMAEAVEKEVRRNENPKEKPKS